MKHLLIPFAATALVLGLSNTSAVAQINRQLSSTSFTASVAPSAVIDYPLDTVLDSDGSRYVVSAYDTGSGFGSYLTKVSALGVIQWSIPVGGQGTGPTASSVAVDGFGYIYVGIADSAGGYVQAYLSNAAPMWQSAANPQLQVKDLVGDAVGVIACGSYNNSAYMGEFYYADGSVLQATVDPFGGVLDSITNAGNGMIYAAGYNYPTVTGPHALIECLQAWDGGSISQSFGDQGDLKEIAMDPASGAAIAAGTIYDPTTGYPQAAVYSFRADLDVNYNLVATGSGSVGTPTPSTIGAGISVNANGTGAYMSTLDLDLATFSYGLGMRKLVVDPSNFSIAIEWMDSIMEEQKRIVAADLTFNPDGNPVVTAACTKKYGKGPDKFGAYHQFTWAPDGTQIDRLQLGNPTQSVSAINNYFPNDLAITGEYGSFYGQTDDGMITQFITKFRSGPDDLYRGHEDASLTVSNPKGVLRNDGNHFDMHNLTALFVPGSASGFNSVSLNANGGFTASPSANFNGPATFSYQLMDGATVLDTHQVTVNFHPVNDDPVAVDDEYTVSGNSGPTTLDVLANDSDPEGNQLHVSNRTTSPNAKIAYTADKTGITFKPKHGFAGDVVFNYTVKDSFGRTALGTVVVHVNP